MLISNNFLFLNSQNKSATGQSFNGIRKKTSNGFVESSKKEQTLIAQRLENYDFLRLADKLSQDGFYSTGADTIELSSKNTNPSEIHLEFCRDDEESYEDYFYDKSDFLELMTKIKDIALHDEPDRACEINKSYEALNNVIK